MLGALMPISTMKRSEFASNWLLLHCNVMVAQYWVLFAFRAIHHVKTDGKTCFVKHTITKEISKRDRHN